MTYFIVGKPKWVPLPFENNEGTETIPTPTINSQNVPKPSSTKPNRTGRNARGGRGNNRNRTRSLDGATPKRNRKNRTAAAVGHNGYQDYYSYYCMMFDTSQYKIVMNFFFFFERL